MPERKGEMPHSPEKKKKIVVEIGPGGAPAFVVGNRELSENEIYLAVDKNIDSIKNVKSNFEDTKNFHPVLGNAERLMFRDASVDELIYNNVFGDPFTKGRDGILAEAARVLRPEGRIIISETYTPEFSHIRNYTLGKGHGFVFPQLNDEVFFSQFRKFGLEVESFTTNLKDLQEFDRSAKDGYRLILKKKN